MNTSPFMHKFALEERKKLLTQSFYESYKEGSVIFHQGDIGDYMYLILKGTVGVRMTGTSWGPEPFIITTLREKDHFGELALLNEEDSIVQNKSESKADNPKEKLSKRQIAKARRRASCVCIEDTHLLAFPANVVNQVVNELLNNKLKSDIEFFKEVDYFSEINGAEFFPLLNNMKKLCYSYGEYIIKEGEIPQGMYIIKSGQCTAYIENIGERSIGDCPNNNNLSQHANSSTRVSLDKLIMIRGDNNATLKKSCDKLVYNNLVIN